MKFMVWDPDARDEEDATEIDNEEPEWAAREAVEKWNNNGDFSGDPFPESGLDVNVRAEDGSLYQVSVYVDYEPVFSTAKPKKIG